MDANFSIQVDVPRSLVRIVLSGFFEREDIARFIEARDEAHTQLRCGPNQHLSLVDIRMMNIQSQDSVAQFQAMLNNPVAISRRLAIVVARSLARMQVKRAAENREPQFFVDIADAERWLFSDDDGDAPDQSALSA
jgi:hypothetical protein